MESDTRLVKLSHDLVQQGYSDVLIVVRSTSLNSLRAFGTESLVRATQTHLSAIIESEAMESTRGVDKGCQVALLGPPALPDSLNKMCLSSLKSYCKELTEFEQAISANFGSIVPRVNGMGTLLENHYRSIIMQFFAHHALDVQRNVIFTTETIAVNTDDWFTTEIKSEPISGPKDTAKSLNIQGCLESSPQSQRTFDQEWKEEEVDDYREGDRTSNLDLSKLDSFDDSIDIEEPSLNKNSLTGLPLKRKGKKSIATKASVATKTSSSKEHRILEARDPVDKYPLIICHVPLKRLKLKEEDDEEEVEDVNRPKKMRLNGQPAEVKVQLAEEEECLTDLADPNVSTSTTSSPVVFRSRDPSSLGPQPVKRKQLSKGKRGRPVIGEGAIVFPMPFKSTDQVKLKKAPNLWLPFPQPLEDMNNSACLIQEYLVTFLRTILDDFNPNFNDPKIKPKFWPKWAKWDNPQNIPKVDCQRILTELMEYFCIDPAAPPVDRVGYECRRLGMRISSRFKKYLDVPSQMFIGEKLISSYSEIEEQVCSTPPLPAQLEKSMKLDLPQYLYALYEQLNHILGERAVEPFRDELTLKVRYHNIKETVEKYLKYFNLKPRIEPKTCFAAYGLIRIRHFTQNMAHAMTETQEYPPVDFCQGWPKPPHPLSDLSDFEMSNYLIRVVMFLLGQFPNWTNQFSSHTFWPSWAEWKDPRNVDVDVNLKILRHILGQHNILEQDLQINKREWPPVPKPLNEFDFIDVVAYITIVVDHMTGKKPNLTKQTDQPLFWGKNWGLPEHLEQVEDPNWAKKWTSTQIIELEAIIKKYGPTEGVRIDRAGYCRRYLRCFPFMGRFGDIDRIALKRLRTCQPILEQGKILLVCWPKLDLGRKVVDEASIRGYLTEIVMYLSGCHVQWGQPHEQPEYWLKDVSWKHPFSGSLPLADILKMIIHCLEYFGPEYIGCLHESDYTKLAEGSSKVFYYTDMERFSNDILFVKDEFIQLCRTTAAQLTEKLSAGIQMKITRLVCRICLWSTSQITDKARESVVLGSLRSHMMKTHMESALCEICCKSFQSPAHLESHVQNFHLRTKMDSCKICGKVIKCQMAKHMLVHEEKKIQCPECPKTFRHISNMNVHRKYHLKVRPFPCEICGQGFARKQNYQRHMSKHKQNDYHLPI